MRSHQAKYMVPSGGPYDHTDCQRKLEEAEAKIAALTDCLESHVGILAAVIGRWTTSDNEMEKHFAERADEEAAKSKDLRCCDGLANQARALLDKARKYDEAELQLRTAALGLQDARDWAASLKRERDSLREQLARVTWERDDAANKALEAGQQLAASKARRTSHQNST